MSAALAGGFLSTAPPGKSLIVLLITITIIIINNNRLINVYCVFSEGLGIVLTALHLLFDLIL